MDLNQAIDKASAAARRGDLDALEAELRRLRRVGDDKVEILDAQLRGIARSVRCHPSFRDARRAQAV